MRRIALAFLAVSSVLLAASATCAATRPHYGGTLHVSMHGAAVSLDPADETRTDFFGRRNLITLIFDTLVTLDDRGNPQPSLATAWHADSGRWQITLRREVRFQDGSQLTSEQAASSLQGANPRWKITAAPEGLIIESDDPNVLAQLALPRNAIVKRGPQLFGTGPFAVANWQPGRHVTLAAYDDCWRGRPFLDAIEIEMGKSYRDQMLALDARRAEVSEIPAEQARRAAAEGRRLESSAPLELVALVFTHEPRSEDEGKLRDALRYAIDRPSISSVLLQNGGDPSPALLPQWMSGYAFLFPSAADLGRARQLRGLLPAPTWGLTYDPNDPLARVIAERVLLNGQDVGLRLQLTTAAADISVVRVPLTSLDPQVALENLAAGIGLPAPKFSNRSPESLYSVETTLLQSRRVIPLVYVPTCYGISSAVHDWSQARDGGWRLENVWLEKP